MILSAIQISQRRKHLGYTQVQLAVLADISLPTLQNIEAGKANPSLDTLTQLFAALGLSIQVQEVEPNWDVLAALGVPLSAKAANVTAEMVKRELRKCSAYLVTSKHQGREEEALIAFFCALRDHYPTLFSAYVTKEVRLVIDEKIKRMDRGRLLRLRRASLSSLRLELLR